MINGCLVCIYVGLQPRIPNWNLFCCKIGKTLNKHLKHLKHFELSSPTKLIMASYYLRFRPRSSRITVRCLQGEGKQRIVRPGTSLFYLVLLEQPRQVIRNDSAIQELVYISKIFRSRQKCRIFPTLIA